MHPSTMKQQTEELEMRIERARRILSEVRVDKAKWIHVLKREQAVLNQSSKELIGGLIWNSSRAERAIEDWLDEVEISGVEG